MKRPLIATFSAALALAATAASADYVRYYTVERAEPVAPVTVVETVTYPAQPVIYEERVVPSDTIIVEGTRVYRPTPDEVLLMPGYPDRSGYRDHVSAMNPQTGQLIGYGLFNRAGPNDFGGGNG